MTRRCSALVLLLFTASVVYADAAEAFGIHDTRPSGCDDASLHLCGEQTLHDADHCTLCHVGGISFALLTLETFVDVVRFGEAPSSDLRPSVRTSEFEPFSPRAPPVLAS